MKRNVTVRFEHTGGGDSLLPLSDRGFFDDYEVSIMGARTPSEAAARGLVILRKEVQENHSNWPLDATTDLEEIVLLNGKVVKFDLWLVPFFQMEN